MLAYEVDGQGPPLLLIHGTMSSRRVWDPVRERLARERRLILIDLPGMGDSPVLPGANVPSQWIEAIGEVLDKVGAPHPSVMGHSMGGWTALELAKAGRASSVLALAPAGLWLRSPRAASRSLRTGHLMALATPPRLIERAMAVPAVRRVALRDASVDGRAVPAAWAIRLAADSRRATGFRDHFRAARGDRFRGGQQIEVPVHVVFASNDRIATPAEAQIIEELPARAKVDRWDNCGHMLMWDATDRVIDAALELPAPTEDGA
jgi:pimeloyl-ACP methyl ester carboxylesterase